MYALADASAQSFGSGAYFVLLNLRFLKQQHAILAILAGAEGQCSDHAGCQ